jgi:transposase
LGFDGWRVVDALFEAPDGRSLLVVGNYLPPSDARLILRVERRWLPVCGQCGRRCRKEHCVEETRRWKDLPWGEHRISIEYTPVRVVCRSCGTPTEGVPWADPYDRETRRFQHQLALQAASMPILRVAAQYGLSWSAVRRAEKAAIARWEAQRPKLVIRNVGVDEKYLGRRNSRDEKFVTIISDLDSGEPVWIGFGRKEATLKRWLDALSKAQKKRIRLFAMDMHDAFKNAVRNDPQLAHAAVVHDPFHVMKRANEAVDELRRSVFFRAGPEMRELGRGKRWLFLRAWERCSSPEQSTLKQLLRSNTRLAAAYQVKEELRGVLGAPDEEAMGVGMARLLRRTQRKSNV